MPTAPLAEKSARVPGHIAIESTAEKSSSDTRAPYDPPPRVDSPRYVDTDDRKEPASVGGPAPSLRKAMAIGISRDDAAATLAAGYQSRSLSVTSRAVASASRPIAVDLHASTAVPGNASSVSISKDGEAAHDRDSFRRVAISLASGPSPSTGAAAIGVRREQVQPSSGRAVADEPDVLRRGPAPLAEGAAATGKVPLPAPQGAGLITHLPLPGRAAFERAFNHWFARIEGHGDAGEGSNETRPMRLLPLSLTAAAVLASISLLRLVRRGERARGDGRRGPILDFPVAWSERIP